MTVNSSSFLFLFFSPFPDYVICTLPSGIGWVIKYDIFLHFQCVTIFDAIFPFFCGKCMSAMSYLSPSCYNLVYTAAFIQYNLRLFAYHHKLFIIASLKFYDD